VLEHSKIQLSKSSKERIEGDIVDLVTSIRNNQQKKLLEKNLFLFRYRLGHARSNVGRLGMRKGNHVVDLLHRFRKRNYYANGSQ